MYAALQLDPYNPDIVYGPDTFAPQLEVYLCLYGVLA